MLNRNKYPVALTFGLAAVVGSGALTGRSSSAPECMATQITTERPYDGSPNNPKGIVVTVPRSESR